MSNPTVALAARIKAEREARGWSLADAADRSGVSRAMISKIERGESSPTAALLGRLCAAFGLTMSTLLARAEGIASGRLSRAAQQPRWRDPETLYMRRALSPTIGGPLDMVLVDLPAGAEVTYPAATYTYTHHQIWVMIGQLTFIEGADVHVLETGDCLTLGPPSDCTFSNRTADVCTYLVAVVGR